MEFWDGHGIISDIKNRKIKLWTQILDAKVFLKRNFLRILTDAPKKDVSRRRMSRLTGLSDAWLVSGLL